MPFAYPKPGKEIDDDASEEEVDAEDSPVGCLDLGALQPNSLTSSNIDGTVTFLAQDARKRQLAALSIRCGSGSALNEVNKLLSKLHKELQDEIKIVFQAHHDASLWSDVDLSPTAGVIIENACIIPNGERRDYFHSQALRQIVARAAGQRDGKPEYFLGFLELWEEQPHPAVIRRAIKLAEHFGAHLEHGPASAIVASERVAPAATTLSAFEYLKRSEISKLQSCWTSASRKVKISSETSNSRSLNTKMLTSVIPDATKLFEHEELPEQLVVVRAEEPVFVNSPEYLAVAPKCDSFWHSARDGTVLSPHGCYSIYTEPTVEDYAAIVQSQKHLKELNLLLSVEGTESSRMIQAFRSLASKGRCASLVQDLVIGLESSDICVYKGMDTGFKLPEGATSFWGVSTNRDATYTMSVDIFISQKAPNAIAAVLHTWLAHHRVGRDVRFEYEALLESLTMKGANGILPSSIATSISQATHAETLQLLERINVTELSGRLRDAIVGHCQLVLIDQTTVTHRMHTYGRYLLDGSVTMEQALASRLEDYARLGATSLPALANLVQFHELLSNAIREALFHGNRTHLNAFALALRSALNPFSASSEQQYVDVNADLFALIFFSVLRQSAFEEVYIESTDRCPLLLQPDQAAVFAELWVLGSQCEIYFGILPRDLGEIIYHRYHSVLLNRPPRTSDRTDNEIMTMYSDVSAANKKPTKKHVKTTVATMHERKEKVKEMIANLGAMSFFCAPAIIDVVLLTFLGRGLLMTGFFDDSHHLSAAVYGILLSLLVSAGVVGWAGSTGNYYLAHYAYDNMIHFHVSRIASGIIVAFLIGVVGVIVITPLYDIGAGFVFMGYMIGVTTYLNLLGILSTMHQKDSPLTSGRTVVWRTFPVLFISPVLSTFVPHYDLAIYLSVLYVFLFLVLYQYSIICHEWSGWVDKMQKFGEKDIVAWHEKKMEAANGKEKAASQSQKEPLEAFRNAIDGYQRRSAAARSSGILNDPFVAKIAHSMPYIDWLFKKAAPNGKLPPAFSSGWFTQLGEAQNQQRQLIRGLKEHNIVILYRMARFDIGQSVGLFLIALMDRWVGIVMEGRSPRPNLYGGYPVTTSNPFNTPDGTNKNSDNPQPRYAVCFDLIYFCLSVMILDMVLQNYWGFRFEASKEPLRDFAHSQAVQQAAERKRRYTFLKALLELLLRQCILFGAATILLWLFVDQTIPIAVYYLYIVGYTCVIIFQFNRCFTTNLKAHITTIFVSGFIGFVVGCTLRAIPATASLFFSEIAAQTTASVLAALGTSLWCWKDFFAKETDPLIYTKKSSSDQDGLWIQRKISAESEVRATINSSQAQRIGGRVIRGRVSSPVCEDVGRRLRDSLAQSKHAGDALEDQELLERAVALWQGGRIEVVAVPSIDFSSLGMGDACSFSHIDDDGNLSIKLGMFGEAELGLSSWHPVLAIVSAECILYHVARVEYGKTHSQAVRAEHYLDGTVSMSKRIEIEILIADPELLLRYMGRTNTEVMRRLCWDLDVDVEWQHLPQSVREAILLRISEKPVAWNDDVRQWVEDRGIDMATNDFHLVLCLAVFRACWQRYESSAALLADVEQFHTSESLADLIPVRIVNGKATLIERIFGSIAAVPLSAVKWVAIISGGATNIERELKYKFKNVLIGTLFLRTTLLAWRICKFFRECLVHTLLLYGRHSLKSVATLVFSGEQRRITNNSVAVVRPRKPITAFVNADCGDEGAYLVLDAYDESLQAAPENKTASFKASYDDSFRLVRRDESDGTYCTYSYSSDKEKRWPLYREHFDKDTKIVGFYDKYGRIQHGTMAIGTTEITFAYQYKTTPKGATNILRADFAHGTSTVSLNKLSVYWGEPPREDDVTTCDWVPSDKVYRIDRMVDGKSYVTELEYRHRRDPVSTTFLKDNADFRTAVVDVPKVFFENPVLLKKPHRPSFDADDLLIYHSTRLIRHLRHSTIPTLSLMSRWSLLKYFGRTVDLALPTWRIRTELWHAWLKGSIDAPMVCWLDEVILRKEPLLFPYWRAREAGNVEAAVRLLDQNISQIASSIELATDVAELCLLPIKTTDLYHMGLGRDATEITTRPQDCYSDTKDRVSVIVNDIGCWPESPGGVSNCRRDLVNGHSTIRNHVLAECANDYGIPRFQIEKNVQSLKLLPLWGLDDKTAYHGLTENILQSQVDVKIGNTDKQRDIQGVFVPLLMDFVKGARTKTYSRADLIKYTNVFLSMAKYYEQKDYNLTWNSQIVADAWADAWLVPYDDPNIADPVEHFELQRPSRHDFREAMGIYMAYFFIFSVQIPEECPRVFQSTHHGISSLFGMILKYKRGVTFGIWDHAILWRETCLNISPAQCELSIPVQSMLLGGIRLASRLSYFHADMIVPCTSLFNPMWEADIGTDRGKLSNKNEFVRKIDPIVNGISNMDSFTPVKATRTDKPTAVMLSNVQFIKGIRTAIVAADVIVNRYSFKDYKLLIYGAKDRQPSYALEMAKLIVKCGLSENVVLAGFGKPDQVLQDAWIFVNSSISEGLPLAIGEAALAGVPIVATEVGATALVITDPDNQDERYGEVVAPNDPVALARAQLRLLCMVGPWAKFTSDEPEGGIDLPEEFAPEDVTSLSKRMEQKSDDRHKLGLLSREVVKRSFHGHRYLREHEQMYWVQWHLARMRANPALNRRTRIAYRFNANPPLMYMETPMPDDIDVDSVIETDIATLNGTNSSRNSVYEGVSPPRSEKRFGLSRLLLKQPLIEPYSPTPSIKGRANFENWAPG